MEGPEPDRQCFKIYLPKLVHGDWPIGHKSIAQPGVHDAVANQHGAVAVILTDGSLLGVKPDEFEFIEGEPLPTSVWPTLALKQGRPYRENETSTS
jgi:hypothetical protein